MRHDVIPRDELGAVFADPWPPVGMLTSPFRGGVCECIFSAGDTLKAITRSSSTMRGPGQAGRRRGSLSVARRRQRHRAGGGSRSHLPSRGSPGIGEAELKVSLRAAMLTVTIHVEIDGRVLEAERYLTFDWAGPPRQWPPLEEAALQAVATNLRMRAPRTVDPD